MNSAAKAGGVVSLIQALCYICGFARVCFVDDQSHTIAQADV